MKDTEGITCDASSEFTLTWPCSVKAELVNVVNGWSSSCIFENAVVQ